MALVSVVMIAIAIVAMTSTVSRQTERPIALEPSQQPPPSSTDAPPSPPSANRVAPSTDTKHERVRWDEYGGAPIAVLADAKETVLGRIRALDADDLLYVVAFDSATLEKRWQAGPFGTYLDGYLNTYFVVIGNRVIISDLHSKLHFLQLETGQESATLALTDRVECMSVEKGKVRLIQADDKSLFVDPIDQTTTAIPKHLSRKRWEDQNCERRSIDRKSRAISGAPPVGGFKTNRVFIDGNDGIAAGATSPGTPVPQVLAFDAQSRRVRWRQTLPSVDPNTVKADGALAGALAGHRYVGVYPVGSDTHRLTSFDSRDGARLWDVKLRGLHGIDDINDLVLTEQYVYVIRSGSLDVLNAETGKLIGAIGDAAYDEGE